jgi:branched-subunit amino acid transport protein
LRLVAAVVAGLVAYRTRRLWAAILVGLAVYWLLRLIAVVAAVSQ